MKRLALFRHAKTERDSDSGRDFDRRLTERGQRDAGRIGTQIRRLGISFDLTLSSPAARAVETAQNAGLSPQLDQAIYVASAEDLLAKVQQVDDGVSAVMLIGHNPAFELLASKLAGQFVEMPTGAFAELEVAVDRWSEVGDGAATMVRFLKPKELDQS